MEKEVFISINLGSDEYDRLFKTAPIYEKHVIVKARKAKAGETIISTINRGKDNFKETVNRAENGDFIITNPGGEEYIIRGDKFTGLYKKLPDGTFKALGEVKGIRTVANVEFEAPWGERMKIRAGGYLVDANGERYGIDETIFKKTYRLKK